MKKHKEVYMTVFPDSAAAGYDEHCLARVPGYELAQELAVSLATVLIPDNSKILISGCGTGNDLTGLAKANSTWSFTAIEPSKGMLEKADQRIEEAGWKNRVAFINERMENAPAGRHSGALSFLVGHFIKGEEAKLAYLQALADRLESSAPLLIFDLCLDRFESTVNSAYIDWMKGQGLSNHESLAVISRIKKYWGPITLDQYQALLEKAGFWDLYVFCRALNYQAFMVRKV